MSEFQNLVTKAYEQAKSGNWDQVMSEWKEIPLLARRCSRYQRRSSGWTFLHQAAYFGRGMKAGHKMRLWRAGRYHRKRLDLTGRGQIHHLRLRKKADEVIARVAWLLCCRPLTGLDSRDDERIDMEYADECQRAM